MSSDDLVRRVRAAGGDERPVAVPLEDYLQGNDDMGAFAPNHTDHPGVAALGAAVAALGAPVFALVTELECPGTYPDGEWPYAPSVLVATDRPIAELAEAAERLEAEAWETAADDLAAFPEVPPAPPGTRYVTIWWD